jgi:four helix bundle protein
LEEKMIQIVPSEATSANRDRKNRALGHEKLDDYRLAIGSVAWVFEHSGRLNGVHRHARDQWLRASQLMPLNIAQGNGKTAEADRRRHFEVARGSALECAAIQDVLVVGKGLEDVASLGTIPIKQISYQALHSTRTSRVSELDLRSPTP